jgi:hypothetical protein
MKAQTKLALRRFGLRCVRKLLDFLDDRLHAAEVRFREQLELERANGLPVHLPVEPSGPARTERSAVPSFDPFPQDELLRHRVRGRLSLNRQPQRAAKTSRRGISAAAFDLRFSQR